MVPSVRLRRHAAERLPSVADRNAADSPAIGRPDAPSHHITSVVVIAGISVAVRISAIIVGCGEAETETQANSRTAEAATTPPTATETAATETATPETTTEPPQSTTAESTAAETTTAAAATCLRGHRTCTQQDGGCADQTEAVDAKHNHQRQTTRDDVAEAGSGMGHVSLLPFFSPHAQSRTGNFMQSGGSSHVSRKVSGENPGIAIKFQRKNSVRVAIFRLTPV